jgi:hypothetical protein
MTGSVPLRAIGLAFLGLLLTTTGTASEPFALAEDDGYRGLWYANQKTGDQYAYKYSGGMGTYPQQHLPIAIYAPAVNKTFFVYGGSPVGKQRGLHMVSYFDHATGSVPRPRILLDKKSSDAHDNPVLSIDRQGYLWIFSNAHGAAPPAYIHRSAEPYAIDRFQHVLTTNFSYGQPWAMDDGSLLLMHTRYVGGKRQMFVMNSADGFTWSEPRLLARVAQGHYQVSWSDGKRVATMFNYHPHQGGLNARTNLYYMESTDAGHTWHNVAGETIALPLESADNPARAFDYESEARLVYLKQLQFDKQGHPLLMYLTSGGYEPGPANVPRTWTLARWDRNAWQRSEITTSDHNYDFGSLYLEANGVWRLIAPTAPGAQPFGTGGQMEMWTSNEGRNWNKVKSLTHDAKYNHSYARQPLGARPDFYALWGSGDTLRPSESELFFTDRDGSHVWRLPTKMDTPTAKPAIAW